MYTLSLEKLILYLEFLKDGPNKLNGYHIHKYDTLDRSPKELSQLSPSVSCIPFMNETYPPPGFNQITG